MLASSSEVSYASCPLQIVVDLSSTRMDACVEKPASAVQPAPTATIAGSTDFADNQFFDVTGLIQEVQEIRQHNNDRSSFIVKIYDGSVDNETQKVKAMLLNIYFDTLISSRLVQTVLNGLCLVRPSKHF